MVVNDKKNTTKSIDPSNDSKRNLRPIDDNKLVKLRLRHPFKQQDITFKSKYGSYITESEDYEDNKAKLVESTKEYKPEELDSSDLIHDKIDTKPKKSLIPFKSKKEKFKSSKYGENINSLNADLLIKKEEEKVVAKQPEVVEQKVEEIKPEQNTTNDSSDSLYEVTSLGTKIPINKENTELKTETPIAKELPPIENDEVQAVEVKVPEISEELKKRLSPELTQSLGLEVKGNEVKEIKTFEPEYWSQKVIVAKPVVLEVKKEEEKIVETKDSLPKLKPVELSADEASKIIEENKDEENQEEIKEVINEDEITVPTENEVTDVVEDIQKEIVATEQVEETEKVTNNGIKLKEIDALSKVQNKSETKPEIKLKEVVAEEKEIKLKEVDHQELLEAENEELIFTQEINDITEKIDLERMNSDNRQPIFKEVSGVKMSKKQQKIISDLPRRQVEEAIGINSKFDYDNNYAVFFEGVRDNDPIDIVEGLERKVIQSNISPNQVSPVYLTEAQLQTIGQDYIKKPRDIEKARYMDFEEDINLSEMAIDLQKSEFKRLIREERVRVQADKINFYKENVTLPKQETKGLHKEQWYKEKMPSAHDKEVIEKISNAEIELFKLNDELNEEDAMRAKGIVKEVELPNQIASPKDLKNLEKLDREMMKEAKRIEKLGWPTLVDELPLPSDWHLPDEAEMRENEKENTAVLKREFELNNKLKPENLRDDFSKNASWKFDESIKLIDDPRLQKKYFSIKQLNRFDTLFQDNWVEVTTKNLENQVKVIKAEIVSETEKIDTNYEKVRFLQRERDYLRMLINQLTKGLKLVDLRPKPKPKKPKKGEEPIIEEPVIPVDPVVEDLKNKSLDFVEGSMAEEIFKKLSKID